MTEEIPYLQSVSIGIWVRAGSRFETPDQNGICHFIEHMLFKGTPRRTAYAIAKEIDSVGGVLNAFTSKELTAFYCRVMAENLEMAVDLLADIFVNSSFPEDEIEREKQVICQEIHQIEDSPEDLVQEVLEMEFWQDDPLGKPILGSIPNILRLDRETIGSFKASAYGPEETVVCAAGKVNHWHFSDLMARFMGDLAPGARNHFSSVPRIGNSAHVVKRDIEQEHLCVASPGPSAVEDRRHAGYILNAILGGGMSSRLFQEIREKNGLAYSVYSFLSSLSDTGMFGIYAGFDSARTEELLAILKRQMERLPSTMTPEEIETAKNQIKGNLILAMESTEARMNRLAKSEYYSGRFVGLDETIAALERVTASDLSALAEEVVAPDHLTVVALGPVDEQRNLFESFLS